MTRQQDELMVPTVHLNGTGRDELLAQITNAISAISDALDAMAKASPHPRDFYVQPADDMGNTAWDIALAQHRLRTQKVTEVMNDLGEVYAAVFDQEGI